MKTLCTCLAIAILGAAVPLLGQQTRLETTVVQEAPDAPPVMVPGAAPHNLAFMVQRQRDVSERDKVMQALREAGTDEDRQAAEKQLRELLDTEYDAALDDYEKYLDELQEKIAELRQQVSKRRAARDEMVDLRLQMLVSEADGLGWPNDGGSLRHLFPGRVQWGPARLERPFGMSVPPVPETPDVPAPQPPGGRTR